MSAVAATKPLAVGSPATLALYRDDGPIAQAIARAVRLPVPGFAVTLLAVLPLFAAIVVEGRGASNGLAAAVVAWAVVVGGLGRGARDETGLRWTSTPLLRAGEYAGVIWLGALDGAEAASFALLAVVAFRHYDLVYRLRTRSETPPAWLNLVSGGWDGRLLAVLALLLLGALPAGLFVVAAVLGVLFAAEAISGWRAFLTQQRGSATTSYEDEEDETD